MARFLVEMEGRSVELDILPDCEVRGTVLPIATRLSAYLADLSEPVDVVFCIDDDGKLPL
ncbi:MAG TPA: hypothetical protein VGN98_06150 [Tianweitania sediminis]|jgi:hypothetical protein|nr:hypothetical protein [Tianweitania sediminis]